MDMYNEISASCKKTVAELKNMPWKKCVIDVMLPTMAGHQNNRWRIADPFMKFMARYAKEVVMEDFRVGINLLEIAMQRLSNGAVLHEAASWPEPLEKEYWSYSSRWDEPGLMSEGCYQFIVSGLPVCLQYQETREHALKILFGLISYLDADGTLQSGYMLPDEFKREGAFLYGFAKTQIEKNAKMEEVYRHYAQPEEWKKHKSWFAEHAKEMNWKEFFSKIRVKGFFNKRRIKKEILALAA